MAQQETQFNLWKQIVSLPREFPKLPPISEEDYARNPSLFFDASREKPIREISILASGPANMVSIESGQGATALFDHIYRITDREATNRAVIPVAIGLEQLGEGFSSANFRETVRRQIVWQLIFQKWQYVIGEDIYRNWIPDAGRIKGTVTHIPVSTLVNRVMNDEDGLKHVEKYAPKLAVPLPELIAGIPSSRIFVSLQVDFSSSLSRQDPRAHGKNVSKLADSIHHLEEDVQSKAPGTQLMRKLFYVNPEFQSSFGRHGSDFGAIRFPVYQPVEIFAMLISRYREGPLLSSVVDPSFLNMPEVYGPRLSIQQIIINFENQLKQAAQAGNALGYKLEPKK